MKWLCNLWFVCMFNYLCTTLYVQLNFINYLLDRSAVNQYGGSATGPQLIFGSTLCTTAIDFIVSRLNYISLNICLTEVQHDEWYFWLKTKRLAASSLSLLKLRTCIFHKQNKKTKEQNKCSSGVNDDCTPCTLCKCLWWTRRMK